MPTRAESQRVTATRGYSATKDQLLARLRRIEGQVRGVERMVDEDRYCIDVLTQIGAIQAALDKVALGLLDDHARTRASGPQGPRGPAGAPGQGAGGSVNTHVELHSSLCYSRQKLRAKSTSTGTISSRPRYISAVRTSVARSLNGSNDPMGPAKPSPGPTPPSAVAESAKA